MRSTENLSAYSWKTQGRMPPCAKVDLTPENILFLTPLDIGRRGQFYFSLSVFEGFELADTFTGKWEEEGIKGRSLAGKKKLVIVAIEIVNEGEGFDRAYAQVIDDASADSFRPFFNKYISKEAEVVTDEWNGYIPLKKDYPKLRQVPSDNGKSHPEMHIHIMNIKGWLRGIHHHC